MLAVECRYGYTVWFWKLWFPNLWRAPSSIIGTYELCGSLCYLPTASSAIAQFFKLQEVTQLIHLREGGKPLL